MTISAFSAFGFKKSLFPRKSTASEMRGMGALRRLSAFHCLPVLEQKFARPTEKYMLTEPRPVSDDLFIATGWVIVVLFAVQLGKF